MQFSPPSHHSIPLWSKYSPQHPVLMKFHKEVYFDNGEYMNNIGDTKSLCFSSQGAFIPYIVVSTENVCIICWGL
jgi:hypothetical protein